MNINTILSRIASGLKRKIAANAILTGAFAFAAIFQISGLACWPRREPALLILGLATVLLCSAGTFALALHGILKYRSLSKLAKHVEESKPGYMDSFITALELESLKRPLRQIEKELLEEVYATLSPEGRSLYPLFPGHGTFSFLWRIFAAAILLYAGSLSTSWRAFSNALFAALKNEPGIIITAPVPDVPLHSDYTIQVSIKRGEQQGEIIWKTCDDDGRTRLNSAEDGGFTFTFYDIPGDLDYRIITPNLSGKWMKIKAYTPPSYLEMRVTARAPAYSKLEDKTLDGPGVIELLEGGELDISMKLDSAYRGVLAPPAGGEIPFTAKDGWQCASVIPVQDGVFAGRIYDSDGHRADFPVTVNILRDSPPEITLIEPADESFLKKDEAVRIAANIADDLGLSSLELEYSISGGERKNMVLKKSDGFREWDYSTLWDLGKLELQPGDILNCRLIARDNKPSPNISRSTLFFVTIRPQLEDTQEDTRNSASEKEADVSDLVAESKRLLRLTWDSTGTSGTSVTEKLKEGLDTLEQETAARKAQLQGMAMGKLGPLGDFFDRAIHSIHSAASIAERKLLEETIPFQENGLAALVLIETELLKNAIKSSSSNDSKEEREGSNEQQQQQKNNNDETGQEGLHIIQEAIAELKRISIQQSNIAAAISAGNNISLLQLAVRQKKLKNDTDIVRQSLTPVRQAMAAAVLLNTAGGEMGGAERSLKTGNAELASRHGERALHGLSQALSVLEDILKESSADEMKKLAGEAADIANSQKEAEKKSREAGADTSSLRKMQEEISNKTSELMSKLRNFGNSLRETAPKTELDINEAVNKASSQGLENAQKRAGRSLAYKRMKRAAEEQRKAAEIMEEMADRLKDAAESMNTISEQELRQALDELAKLAEETISASNDSDGTRGKQRIQQARKQASEITGRLAQNINSNELRQTSADLAAPADGNGGSSTTRQIAAAARSIIKILDSITENNRLFMRRGTTAPPEKYRRDVEKYFREISK